MVFLACLLNHWLALHCQFDCACHCLAVELEQWSNSTQWSNGPEWSKRQASGVHGSRVVDAVQHSRKRWISLDSAVERAWFHSVVRPLGKVKAAAWLLEWLSEHLARFWHSVKPEAGQRVEPQRRTERGASKAYHTDATLQCAKEMCTGRSCKRWIKGRSQKGTQNLLDVPSW